MRIRKESCRELCGLSGFQALVSRQGVPHRPTQRALNAITSVVLDQRTRLTCGILNLESCKESIATDAVISLPQAKKHSFRQKKDSMLRCILKVQIRFPFSED